MSIPDNGVLRRALSKPPIGSKPRPPGPPEDLETVIRRAQDRFRPRRTVGATLIGLLALAGYVATIPLANWLIANVGTTCLPDGPCVVPVWPGLYCPSGSLMVGLALVLRDIVQRAYGPLWGLGAIAIGTVVSGLLSPAAIVLASAGSFLVSELADFAVYTPLQKRRFVLAVVLSSAVGLVVDGVLFLSIAFGSLDLLPGIVLGKAWMVLAALPLVVWIRGRLPAR